MGVVFLHPNHSLRAPAPLSNARAEASDPAMLNRYFNLLKEVLTENDLMDRACPIFNMDESGMPLDTPQVRCVAEQGTRDVTAPSSGDKTQITVVACASASGFCMPPMVILNHKLRHYHQSLRRIPGLSPNGWIALWCLVLQSFFTSCSFSSPIVPASRWPF